MSTRDEGFTYVYVNQPCAAQYLQYNNVADVSSANQDGQARSRSISGDVFSLRDPEDFKVGRSGVHRDLEADCIAESDPETQSHNRQTDSGICDDDVAVAVVVVERPWERQLCRPQQSKPTPG